jgi:hypothetical protein
VAMAGRAAGGISPVLDFLLHFFVKKKVELNKKHRPQPFDHHNLFVQQIFLIYCKTIIENGHHL